MKKITHFLLFFGLLFLTTQLTAQGLIGQLNATSDPSSDFPSCGSFDIMEDIDEQAEGFIELSDQFMRQLTKVVKHQQQNKSNAKLYTVPIVFHIVHNTADENLADSVILNQVEILNECFRRQNADTSDTRAEFLDLVGDSRIEFQLADFDPTGAPSNGITRTNTSVTNFGGILPYGAGQGQQIAQWVNDSLYYNYFRLTNDSLGGKSAWNTDEYLNIWIGDLSILEPQFNNFEELVFFALATPPMDHVNWPDSILDQVNVYEQGVLVHYINIGGNNPNQLPPAYSSFNGVTTGGKILVHEVGHYLGLRHIWGDGDCSFDDHIDDTPNSNASSAWSCNLRANTCTDSINNMDFLNMVENYMDYSSNDCQNSFTLGQIDLMRSVLRTYRPFLFDTLSSIAPEELAPTLPLQCYPNPNSGSFTLDLGQFTQKAELQVLNQLGQLMFSKEMQNFSSTQIELNIPPGIYFVRVNTGSEQIRSSKIIVQ